MGMITFHIVVDSDTSVDDSETSVNDAIVRMSIGTLSICGRTNADGRVLFKVPNTATNITPPINEYKVSAYHSSHKLKTTDTVHVNNNNQEKKLKLYSLGTNPGDGVIRVIVTDSSNYNQPIPGVDVKFRNNVTGSIEASGVTDSLGYVELTLHNIAYPIVGIVETSIPTSSTVLYPITVSGNSDQTVLHTA